MNNTAMSGGIMNKTFVYVLPNTFSTEALYLHYEICWSMWNLPKLA